ncbi:recombinase family protein [Sulfurimonas autotrophica]|uniref:Resolvase domain protein n=1 Tax=Sulfurimonas autotrophica (strain ATCC BAA-671 / DSM 16294 / JCM 11897 / OK10) TaxID=563040 RepID=E0UTC1_SULAO|nr:recombinase family protein [Sulfurimonas autotrophica]ADN08224.1 Resolvase domain protein [Sulfurimonas autotrophica DSM 16294]
MILGYIRVSTDKQDNQKQKHLILEYAHSNSLKINDFIEVEISSRKSEKLRKITELKDRLQKDDTLIVAELSRLGRNMMDVMNLIQELSDKGIKLIFIRQPELSTFNSAHNKLLLAIYSYFAESEREFISMRTKQGLAAAKASGKKLGRKPGQKVKSKYDPYLEKIKEMLLKDVSITSIHKIIEFGTYVGLRSYILNNSELNKILTQNKDKTVSLLAINYLDN